MRVFIATNSLLLLLLLTAAPATADGRGTAPPAAEARSAVPPRIQIIEDQEAVAFRFMIDGREVARLDPDGLHVRENIEYGGTLTDAGTAYYDAKAKASATPAGSP